MTRYYLMTQYDESEPRCWALAHLYPPLEVRSELLGRGPEPRHTRNFLDYEPRHLTETYRAHIQLLIHLLARIVSHLLCSFISL